jgi:hypothetical protein
MNYKAFQVKKIYWSGVYYEKPLSLYYWPGFAKLSNTALGWH